MNSKEQIGWQKFIQCCLELSSRTLAQEFMNVILTEEEKQSLATRILILEELLSGRKTQRQIAEELKVSISKITRGSNELKNISPHLKEFLQKEKL